MVEAQTSKPPAAQGRAVRHRWAMERNPARHLDRQEASGDRAWWVEWTDSCAKRGSVPSSSTIWIPTNVHGVGSRSRIPWCSRNCWSSVHICEDLRPVRRTRPNSVTVGAESRVRLRNRRGMRALPGMRVLPCDLRRQPDRGRVHRLLDVSIRSGLRGSRCTNLCDPARRNAEPCWRTGLSLRSVLSLWRALRMAAVGAVAAAVVAGTSGCGCSCVLVTIGMLGRNRWLAGADFFRTRYGGAARCCRRGAHWNGELSARARYSR